MVLYLFAQVDCKRILWLFGIRLFVFYDTKLSSTVAHRDISQTRVIKLRDYYG